MPISLPACSAKPEAPRTLMMRDRGSRAHWPANPTPWHGNKALLPMCSNRAAIETPPLPLPYKYHPTPARTREREKKRGNGEKRKKRTKRKGTERKKKKENGEAGNKGEGL